MYAVVKTIEEAEQLNDYIKAGYYSEVPEANFEQWTDIIQLADGYAVEIMDFMQYRPVPSFIINGVKFIDKVDKPSVSEQIII